MPKKQAQRTKGNLKPSSSSQAAELLSSAGTAPTGFIGFGQGPKYVPVSSSLDDMDISLDSDFRLVLRKLTKRDTTTKIRALQELGQLCTEKSEEDLKAVLPFWPRMFNKLALDIDYRVREATQQAMSTLVSRVRRNLAPYLRNLMGAWLLSQCDTYPTVASAACASFQDAFPPAKQAEVYVFCKDSVMEYLTENLVTQTSQTLSDAKTTEPEDMENKYNRVLTASLLAIRKLVSNLPTNQIQSLKLAVTALLENPKFWKHGKSKVSSVKGAMYSFLACLCQSLPELSTLYVGKITPLVLHNLEEPDSGVYPAVWEAALSLVNYVKDCWQHVSIQKAFWPQLRKVLESGCHGNPQVIGPNILPLLSRIPMDLFADCARFYEEFFTCFRAGLCAGSIQKSPSECGSLVRAYVECAQFVVMKNTESTIATSVLLDQVLPVLEASVLETGSVLYKTPLYSMLGTFLMTVECSNSTQLQQTTNKFWNDLQASVDQKLSVIEELPKGDNFDEKLAYFVKCLYFPQADVKQKTGKVKFETPEDSDIYKATRKIDLLTVKSKNELSNNCKKFVHHLTIRSFDLAHKHLSQKHLKLFAQLLELDPAEDMVAKVISSCHGDDVAKETTSHYFVFHICIPWLQKVQAGGQMLEDFTHIVRVVCIFLSVLDTDTITQLLERLYESCLDTHCQYVLLRELFARSGSVQSVADWLHSNAFGDRLVLNAAFVCEKPVNTEWQVDTSNVLNILALVLATRTPTDELLIPKSNVERLLHVLEKPIRNLAGQPDLASRAELAVSFVSQAMLCFFTKYTECLSTSSAQDLLCYLFDVSLTNQCNVSGDCLQMARDTWVVGVGVLVRQTGGLLNTEGVLMRLADCVRKQVQGLASLHELDCAFLSVQHLLDTVKTSLPDGAENPVYQEYFYSLVGVHMKVPYDVLQYLQVRGVYPAISGKKHSANVVRTLYSALFTSKLLSHVVDSSLTNENQEQGDSDELQSKSCFHWLENHLVCLIDCIQALETVKLYLEQYRMDSLMEPSSDLHSVVAILVSNVPLQTRTELWSLAYTRSMDNSQYVFSLKPLLHLLGSQAGGQIELPLSVILDRCETLTSDVVYMLHMTLTCLTAADLLTFTEILVARVLSLDANACIEGYGVVGLLSVISHLVTMVTDSQQLFTGVLDQILSWKEEEDVLFIYSRPLDGESENLVQFNQEVCRLMCNLVSSVPSSLTDRHWDFIMCSLVSWMQSLEESDIHLAMASTMQCFTSCVLDLVWQVSVCLDLKVGREPEQFPANLQTEWTEFFSESVYEILLLMFVKLCKSIKDTTLCGADRIVLRSLCIATSSCPERLVTNHKLPPLLVAGDLSPLPDTLQTLLNQLCPLLLVPETCVQTSVFCVLNRVIARLPEFDKDDRLKAQSAGATGGQQEESSHRSPPSGIVSLLEESSSVLDVLLCDTPIDLSQPIETGTPEYYYAFTYLLSWKLLLKFFKSAPSELRQEYAGFLQEHGYMSRLMFHIFRLMPNNPQKMFQQPYCMEIRGPESSVLVRQLSCDVYQQLLQTMPAMARTWWKEQDRKTAAYVDTFTSKHVSPLLCTEEIQSVQKTDVLLENMTIKARQSTREVIAVYGFEEVSVEIIISLPPNYPLGPISVSSEKRVGVSGPQWEKWLLQLNIFLQHQNGNIMDGLRLWKNNIDKKFEGVDECMICFYVLHGTNFQLPRITCRTCKKKFHSACLYKWFNTSHNCTCPLCRNVF
ncbi:E3 ubiquitin-protein ligase listerin-like [Dreissena polymorpha]|uniref:E3 ubiquitin-protein ligase listerin n=1 Tax=Dreissena polymorpha TaxID=45954 RepID=A0A9D4CHK8_DREPO|nr:E3 ubiquitin-protein ligase listerin-like [Dreissena polymorpha]KAH3724799.1 hypothetical protein DPMN_050626 [Dreissena polymorpha]